MKHARFSLLLLLTLPVVFGPSVSIAADPLRTVALEVSVIRFKPAKAERLIEGFRNCGTNLMSVVEALKADGEVNILYNGLREVRLEEKSKAKFDATETRPVVLVGKGNTPMPPATVYGLTLDFTVLRSDAERFGLEWTGTISWSPDLVDSWNGDRFLNFLSAAAGIAKKTGVANSKTGNQVMDIGLGLAQAFNPKAKIDADGKSKPTESDIYELPVQKTVALVSSKHCKSGELILHTTTAEMGGKEAQAILLLIVPTVTP